MKFEVECLKTEKEVGYFKVYTNIKGESVYEVGLSIAGAVGRLAMKHNLIPDLEVAYK